MWLINVQTKRLQDFIGSDVPPYAILSHTWASGQEVTFQEMKQADGHIPLEQSSNKTGWQKIEMTCRQAATDGLEYVWVDTCCIDKSSSAELSEAINSMFRWYLRAQICYVYLADLAPSPDFDVQAEGFVDIPPEVLESTIKHCRWFTRSWTLQELIAPSRIAFYNQDWNFCFSKADASDVLSRITGIAVDILEQKKDLSMVSVAQKMSVSSLFLGLARPM